MVYLECSADDFLGDSVGLWMTQRHP
jgi:hypothetical protein